MTDEPRETPPRPIAADDEPEPDAPLGDDLPDDDAPALRALLKRSLADDASAPTPALPSAGVPTEAERALVLGVQRKLRQRSKGKFYADGWSTTQSRVSYAVVAIVMLFTIAVVYFALGPTGIH
jgi:hypothetical protein